eukprot:m.78674 g.78674  ORF g.78674 m.78674 type:complete len:1156 (+) comp36112_c0_seq4:156-3623(+)
MTTTKPPGNQDFSSEEAAYRVSGAVTTDGGDCSESSKNMLRTVAAHSKMRDVAFDLQKAPANQCQDPVLLKSQHKANYFNGFLDTYLSSDDKQQQIIGLLKEANVSKFTCIFALFIEKTAFDLLENALDMASPSLLNWADNRAYLLKAFGTFYSGKPISWADKGRIPLTNSVVEKVVSVATEADLFIPIHVNSVVPSSRCGAESKRLLNLHDRLAPLRRIAELKDAKGDSLPPQVVILGLHETPEIDERTKLLFQRKVQEGLSRRWKKWKIEFCCKDSLKRLFKYKSKIFNWIQEGSDEFLATEHILQSYICKNAFVPQSLLKRYGNGTFHQLVTNLQKRGVIALANQTNPDLKHFMFDFKHIASILLEILEHSEVAKANFKKHGLIPYEVVNDVLDSLCDSEQALWLATIRNYELFIRPADFALAGEHQREHRQPASLSEFPQNSFIVPCLLTERQQPIANPPGYQRTEPLVIRHKGGHRVSECLFYTLAARLIKRYPLAPRCYHRSVRLRVALRHILEMKLENEAIFASMLVQSADKSFRSTGTADVCSKLRQILMGDAALKKSRRPQDELQFGAFMLTHDLTEDFVDLGPETVFPSGAVFSEEGEEFHPLRSFYLWFNCYGPEETLTEKYFARLCEDMDSKKVLRYLVDESKITGEQYREIFVDGKSLTSRNLLLVIENRKENCDVLLRNALLATEQSSLADLLVKGSKCEQSKTSERQHPAQVPSVVQPIQKRSCEEQQRSEEFQRPTAAVKGAVAHPTDNDGEDSPYVIVTKQKQAAFPILHVQKEKFRVEQVLPQDRLRLPFPDGSDKSMAAEAACFPAPPTWRGDGEVREDPKVQPIFEARYFHVERASDNFNERPFSGGGKRLGSGSFGTVYHGVLHSENKQKFEVAIKRFRSGPSLNKAQKDLSKKQFETEMYILTRYFHKNVVHLIGFSSDGSELCLIYEYLSNGALSHRLDCKDNTRPLPWKTRLSIARDTARGLQFLHTCFRHPVVHRDVKSSNVLLTSEFEAKLSDFGLAVVLNDEAQRNPGPAIGTRPYMSPEAREKILTPKMDVYSFGVILYELATGLPPYSRKKNQDLKSYVDEIERQGIDLSKMLDPKAKWPKGRTSQGCLGINLLDVAKKCTIKDYTVRAAIDQIFQQISQLVEKAD